MATSTYHVEGMTCGHCVNSVRDEVAKIAGVEAVDVDLATGRLQIASSTAVAAADVLAAVDEAGYVAKASA